MEGFAVLLALVTSDGERAFGGSSDKEDARARRFAFRFPTTARRRRGRGEGFAAAACGPLLAAAPRRRRGADPSRV